MTKKGLDIMCKRFLAIVLCLLMIAGLAACKGGDDPAATTAATTAAETTAATTAATTLSEEELKQAELVEYLSSVSYRKFELTGSNEPYFMGRWFEKDLDGVRHMVSVTSGSHCYILTDGATSIDVNFTLLTSAVSTHFAYSIDGAEPQRQLCTESKVNLPDAKLHTVRIILDGIYEGHGEKWTDETGYALKSITASEGGVIYGIKPTEKIIFYYGDSITEGIYALGEATKHNSAVNSFTWHSAEKLGATPYFIGYGGTGFTQGVEQSKSFATMIEAIDYNSKDRLVEDGVVPDVIVISHGTNEGSTTVPDFKAAAKAAIDRVIEKYPNTPIFYLGHGSHINNKYAFCELVTRDYDNVYWVGSRDWNITFTDSCHPNAAGAKVLGEKLAAEMIKVLGDDFFE